LRQRSDLQTDLNQRGIVSKKWVSSTGRTWGGVKFGRWPLSWLLRNPIYIGRVSHKVKLSKADRRRFVDLALWEKTE